MELILKYFPELPDLERQRFAALDALYRTWNEKINVISRKDMEGLYEKHVLHSLSIAKVCRFRAGASIIDIGTGGGFPGLPLAILFPECRFHLVDATGKKIRVVDEIARALSLDNVTTAHERVETLKAARYDYAVSRAVAPLKTLVAWSRPVVRPPSPQAAGSLICLKGGDLTEEIAESGTRPRLTEISAFFPEPWFREKYVVEVVLVR